MEGSTQVWVSGVGVRVEATCPSWICDNCPVQINCWVKSKNQTTFTAKEPKEWLLLRPPLFHRVLLNSSFCPEPFPALLHLFSILHPRHKFSVCLKLFLLSIGPKHTAHGSAVRRDLARPYVDTHPLPILDQSGLYTTNIFRKNVHSPLRHGFQTREHFTSQLSTTRSMMQHGSPHFPGAPLNMFITRISKNAYFHLRVNCAQQCLLQIFLLHCGSVLTVTAKWEFW